MTGSIRIPGAALLLATACGLFAAGERLLAPAPLLAQATEGSALPDWSGVWQMTSTTVFDLATVDPPGGSSNAPGTREYPPYNEEWEAKYAAR